MKTKFKKLDIDLPSEKIVNDRPWQIMGWLFAIALVIYMGYAYAKFRNLV